MKRAVKLYVITILLFAVIFITANIFFGITVHRSEKDSYALMNRVFSELANTVRPRFRQKYIFSLQKLTAVSVFSTETVTMKNYGHFKDTAVSKGSWFLSITVQDTVTCGLQ